MEAPKHTSDLLSLVQDRRDNIFCKQARILREQQLRFQFRRRTPRDAHEVCVFLARRTVVTLRNV